MTSSIRAALSIWEDRRPRSRREQAYAVYAVFLLVSVALVPVVRAVWLSATGVDGLAMLSSASAPGVAAMLGASLWAGALLLGRVRGPALYPPFLVYAFAQSDHSGWAVFHRPVVGKGALMVAATAACSALIGVSLASAGLTSFSSAIVFSVIGALVGLVAAVLWLTGQALPRVSLVLAGAIFLGGLTSAAIPPSQHFLPSGWIALLYPGAEASLSEDASPVVGMIALALVCAAAVPRLLGMLDRDRIASQAAVWDSTRTHVGAMDFGAAATMYQRMPSALRHVRAVRSSRHLAPTIFLRDLIGASRSPVRLITGIVGLAIAGALLTLAVSPGMPGWLVGSVGAAVLFAAVGPLTDGIRHAVFVAADLPLYGVSDEFLLFAHALFPIAVVFVVLVIATALMSALLGSAPLAAIVGSLLVGLLSLVARVSNALKGPLPPSLLLPIPTPAGDVSVVFRFAWALDGLLIVGLAGVCLSVGAHGPLLVGALLAVLTGIAANRWRRR